VTPEPTRLPLAAAALRLRKPGGRPRTSPLPAPAMSTSSYAAAITPPPTRMFTGVAGRAEATLAPGRRLLDVAEAATYLSVSPWTIKDLVAAGRLPRVRLPLGADRDLRRLLVDVRDLDALIDGSKERV
jgi:excisionase family DNA binding protein